MKNLIRLVVVVAVLCGLAYLVVRPLILKSEDEPLEAENAQS